MYLRDFYSKIKKILYQTNRLRSMTIRLYLNYEFLSGTVHTLNESVRKMQN